MANMVACMFIAFFLLLSLREWIEILKAHPFVSFAIGLFIISQVANTEAWNTLCKSLSFGMKIAGVAVLVVIILGGIGYCIENKEDKHDEDD